MDSSDKKLLNFFFGYLNKFKKKSISIDNWIFRLLSSHMCSCCRFCQELNFLSMIPVLFRQEVWPTKSSYNSYYIRKMLTPFYIPLDTIKMLNYKHEFYFELIVETMLLTQFSRASCQISMNESQCFVQKSDLSTNFII